MFPPLGVLFHKGDGVFLVLVTEFEHVQAVFDILFLLCSHEFLSAKEKCNVKFKKSLQPEKGLLSVRNFRLLFRQLGDLDLESVDAQAHCLQSDLVGDGKRASGLRRLDGGIIKRGWS